MNSVELALQSLRQTMTNKKGDPKGSPKRL